jgi:hypothetical protein
VGGPHYGFATFRHRRIPYLSPVNGLRHFRKMRHLAGEILLRRDGGAEGVRTPDLLNAIQALGGFGMLCHVEGWWRKLLNT